MQPLPRLVILDDDSPSRLRLRLLLADIAAECAHVLVGEAESVLSARAGMPHWQPDILLLDVQMAGESGMAFAAELLVDSPFAPAIIFITTHTEYAVQAFEVMAVDYLLKPVRAERLAKAIRRALVYRNALVQDRRAKDIESTRRSHVLVHSREQSLQVPIDAVLWLKAEQKYVSLRTASHTYLTEESLQSLEQEFSLQFVRIHRNALVARGAIIGFERCLNKAAASDGLSGQTWQVVLRGLDERLPISRRLWPKMRALLHPLEHGR